jgi:NTP pyrophosphatase (non-canonical NTP hydrolase)
MASALQGEAGELFDAIKKHAVYDKDLDLVNVIEELGDIEFYLEGLRQLLEITRDETVKANIKKLTKRYPDGRYSNKHAKERADKE